jgi:hypothetical protein
MARKHLENPLIRQDVNALLSYVGEKWPFLLPGGAIPSPKELKP